MEGANAVRSAGLVAAVRARDVGAVRALLEGGADPGAVDGRGTPVLLLAVEALDESVVDLLTQYGQPDRDVRERALLRAVDLGVYGIFLAVSSGARLWVEDADGRNALALARQWYEVGVEAGLRRRTGLAGPVRKRTVVGEFGPCRELSLGDVSVQDGHAAILTDLEERYGVLPAFGELMARALAEPDVEHPVWFAVIMALQRRRDPAVWDAGVALRERHEPPARYFGAELLRAINLFDEDEDLPYDSPLTDVFLPWVARETDPLVMVALTAGLADCTDPRAGDALPALARHDDERVRERAVSGLGCWIEAGRPGAVDAAVECSTDGTAVVRRAACRALGRARLRLPDVREALARCLDDSDEGVRVESAVRLTLLDDPRGDDAVERLGPVGEDSPYYWTLYEASHHQWRRRCAVRSP
ncbi:HEAT repeat domain-containing protein [Streptomyces sp. NPDC051940]|uniref:HEAT repeat domain-containing protein n=1 Tax=Streptomyces sp. NPDC051940 TaxID=3155675 RepID=UPI00342F9EB9